jgi:hypothetical protein
MGFSKAQVLTEIPIKFSVEVRDLDTNEITRAICTHNFKRPSSKARERLTDAYIGNPKKGYRASASSTTASVSAEGWKLWKESIISVEGYDDFDPETQSLPEYFSDPMTREHVELAVNLLLGHLGGEEEEEEIEKTSD